MPKLKLLSGVLVLLVSLTLVAVVASLQNTDSSLLKKNHFNILLRYGVGAKNELNTFEGTYTKDMILDSPITISLALSEEELNQIQRKMIEIGFFNYPESFPLRQDRTVAPCTNYYIKVEYGSIVKEVNWNSNSMLEGNVQENLSQLIDCITSIVEQKPEYKALPPARGGYL